ncbi:MAG: dephospho-CoA kinase [Methylococcales bacterium]|nr:dephospho-CoA kinase [Methylococcales bacterium]
MLKIGLTGGIGSGKTTVAKIFQELSVPVIDADEIAHQLVAIGQPALAQITQCFGAELLNEDGSLNRKQMRELIFSEPQHKKKLEAILHPLVYQAILAEAKQLAAPYCIISVPLLLETNMTGLVDRVLVIDCPPETQIERVRQRDGMATGRILSIIASQVPRAVRAARADDLIDNSKTDGKLAEDIKKLHNLYLSLSASQDNRASN